MGTAIVNLLVSRGALVVAADIGTDRTTKLESGCAIHCDVADETSIATTIAAARELGPLTMLVNVAAATGLQQVAADTEVKEMDASVWDAAFAVNARGSMLMTKHALPAMIDAGHGSIVNISSTAAILSIGTGLAYATAKAALHALSTSIATRYGRAGIRCNTLAPGFIETAKSLAANTDKFLVWIAQHNSLSRLGRPQDIAETVAFLLSDAASYITGQLIAVDGGQTTHMPLADTLREKTGGNFRGGDNTQ